MAPERTLLRICREAGASASKCQAEGHERRQDSPLSKVLNWQWTSHCGARSRAAVTPGREQQEKMASFATQLAFGQSRTGN